jgi:N-acetylglucosamine-6-sulfatase
MIAASRHKGGAAVFAIVRRRVAVGLCLFGVALSSTGTLGIGLTSATDRADVIVVMVDDLGAIDERILSRLPNIKSLWIDGGLRFDSAYAETPLCCPGRASFLTGQHTRAHGVVENDARLLDPSRTIATALRGAGYWTVMAGKYLNNANALADKSPPGWDHVALLDWTQSASRWWVDDNRTTAGFDDRFTLEKGVSWLRNAPADRPVFMWLTPRAPHWANSASKPWLPDVEARYAADPRCADIEPWKPPSYDWSTQPDGFPLDAICRSLLTTDEMVGRLRATAAAAGRDPIWVFTSDNGMSWGAHGFPLKNVPSAGRLPLYFAGPGIVAGATDALVSNIDLGPTIAALAGTTMRAAHGVTFAPVLRGEPGGREWMLEDHPLGGATYGPWRAPWWGVRTPEWHLVYIGTRPAQLFDVRRDPWELVNVRRANPEVVRSLTATGSELIATLEPAPTRTPRPTATPTKPPTPAPTPTLRPPPTVAPTPTGRSI